MTMRMDKRAESPFRVFVWGWDDKMGLQDVMQMDLVRSGDGEVTLTVGGAVTMGNVALHDWPEGEWRYWMVQYYDEPDHTRTVLGHGWLKAKAFDEGHFSAKIVTPSLDYPVVKLVLPGADRLPPNLFEAAKEA